MSTETDEQKARDERIKNLLALWLHLNQLLWGRLQTVSALQIAIFGGWYGVFINASSPARQILGACIAGLGVYLSWQMRVWIVADREFRDEKRDQICELDADSLSPKNGKGRNADKMIRMVTVFILANSALLLVSIAKPLCWLSRWIVCGC